MAPCYRVMLPYLLLLTVGAVNGNLLAEYGLSEGNHLEPADRRLQNGAGNHIDGVVSGGKWERLLSETDAGNDQPETSYQASSLVEVHNCPVSGYSAYCKGENVTEIPRDLPSSITSIKFSDTKVTWIPDGVFENYPNLTRIGFRRSSLNNISKGAFSGLPNLKELLLLENLLSDTSFENMEYEGLSSLETLQLRYNKLTKLPMGLLQGASNLRELDLYDNDINQLPLELKFTLTKLVDLNLSMNKLSSINATVLKQMPNLKVLQLGDNLLSDSSFESMENEGLSFLETLDLAQNKLTKLPMGLLQGSPNLRELYLYDNNINQLPSELKFNLTKLAILDLSINKLSSINATVFNQMPNLKELLLRDNLLSDSSFESMEYEGLPFLETLDLAQNKLTKLPMGLLQGSPNLRKLYLFGNNINHVPSQLMFTLTELYELQLSSNKLSSIDATVFNQMPNIRLVSLYKNQISVIHNGAAFMYKPLLYRLYIHSNPFICDCQVLWMVEAREAKKNWAVDWESNPPTCESPSWLHEENIAKLYPQDLTCGKPYIDPITPTYVTHIKDTPLKLKARMTKGLPYSKWLLPNGKLKRGVDSVHAPDHSVLTTLLLGRDFDETGMVNFTLMASNVAGHSNLTFWVYTEPTAGSAVGAPPVYTGTLVLMLICARIFTG